MKRYIPILALVLMAMASLTACKSTPVFDFPPAADGYTGE